MPINVIGFAVAKVEADTRGVGDQESTRIGVIGSVMPNPIMSLVVARAMADREGPAAPDAPAQSSTDITLTPPGDGAQGGGTGSTGGTGNTGGTGSTGTSGGGNVPSGQILLAHIDQARHEAGKAHRAITDLTNRMEARFTAIEERLSGAPSSSFTLENPDRPPRRRRGAAVEEG